MIEDASDDPNVLAAVEAYHWMKNHAEKHAGARIEPPMTRNECIRLQQNILDGPPPFSDTIAIGKPWPPSELPWADLEWMTLDQLRLETRHEGKFLLLRTFTLAVRTCWMDSIATYVEDEHGAVAHLCIRHVEPEHIALAIDMLPRGSMLLLKEPVFTLDTDSAQPVLLVEHVTDFRFVKKDYEIIPPAWREATSEGSDSGEDSEGSEDTTLTLTPDIAYIEYRVQEHTKHERYEWALKEIRSIPTLDRSEGLVYDEVYALFKLGWFLFAFNVLVAYRNRFPDAYWAKVWQAKVMLCLAGQYGCKYDFHSMYQDMDFLGCGTYVGPLKVRYTTNGNGRGLFTTQPVKAGALLLCEKAVAYDGDLSKIGQSPVKGVLLDLDRARATKGIHVNLFTKVLKKLYGNPSSVKDVLKLHGGSPKPVKVFNDGTTVLDSFAIHRIVSLNTIVCPLTSKEAVFKQQDENSTCQSSGIWLWASYINHSCLPNCNRAFIGDMILIRATTDIPVDTELTCWYVTEPPPQGFEQLQNRWDFACTCPVCIWFVEIPEEVQMTRIQLLNDYYDNMERQCSTENMEYRQSHENWNRQTEEFIYMWKQGSAAIELARAIETDLGIPDWVLWDTYYSLAKTLMQLDNLESSGGQEEDLNSTKGARSRGTSGSTSSTRSTSTTRNITGAGNAPSTGSPSSTGSTSDTETTSSTGSARTLVGYDSYSPESRERRQKVLAYALKALSQLGWSAQLKKGRCKIIHWGIVQLGVVEMWLLASGALYHLRRFDESTCALDTARLVYKIIVGEDETWEEMMGARFQAALARDRFWCGLRP